MRDFLEWRKKIHISSSSLRDKKNHRRSAFIDKYTKRDVEFDLLVSSLTSLSWIEHCETEGSGDIVILRYVTIECQTLLYRTVATIYKVVSILRLLSFKQDKYDV